MNSTIVIILITIALLVLALIAFLIIRRRRYVRAQRGRGWTFESRPALESVLDHHAPPFGQGFVREVDEAISGATAAGAPFRVFEYASAYQREAYGRATTSALPRGHRLLEEEFAAKPKLLPSALALGADVVCVVGHPPFYLWFVLAVRALHPRIELQRGPIEEEQERNDPNSHNVGHSVTRPLL